MTRLHQLHDLHGQSPWLGTTSPAATSPAVGCPA
jgi:hypothetical protein